MNPILLDLNFIQIRWYSVFILIGFIIGYFLVTKRCKKLNIPLTKITDMSFYLIIVCIIGARLYYCIFEWEYYLYNLLDVFKIWEGGLAIHGGIIAGVIFIFFYTKKKELNFIQILDIFTPALVLGQAIGRWGNFFNQEAFGPITTLSTLKQYNIPQFIIDGMYINNNYHHPTFFYESIGCLIIFFIIMLVRNIKKIKLGTCVSIYLIGYGIIRFFIESLRQDSLMLFNIKVAQFISIIMIIIGIGIIIYNIIKKN